ncbi:MAG: alpha/beta hydrolase [Rubrobacter sp.]|nr:alpha/beta hydrolase [Rubrobacter sp.]
MEKSFWTMDRVPGDVELAMGRAGQGPNPLVCLHGITAQHRAFNTPARHLSPSHSLAAVDLRGRGDSDKPETGYGLDAHASDVVRVLDYLGMERAILAGHSMGAFVALQTALRHPDRVRALVLLDGGWPRIEISPEDLTEEQKQEAQEMREGLARAFSRLDMVFQSPEDYLNFWFPGQNLTMDDLPPDLADYYHYDLGKVENGYQPKASSRAANEDSPWVSSRAPTAEEMSAVRCPVSLVRASEGFFPRSEPLISADALAAMTDALDIRSDTRLEGANHYSMLFGDHGQKAAQAIEDFLQRIE